MSSDREADTSNGCSSPRALQSVKRSPGKFDSPRRPASCGSPDSTCSICLGEIENRAFTNSCFHEFCYTCLLQWSKQKPECPLCKQKFKKIIHNVRSIDDYDVYDVPSPAAVPLHHHPFFPGVAPGGGGAGLFDVTWAARLNLLRNPPPGTRAAERQLFNFLRRRSTPSPTADGGGAGISGGMPMAEFFGSANLERHRGRLHRHVVDRYEVYRNMRWARMPSEGRLRDTSPAFFQRNQTALHRLVPWLSRELHVLLGSRAQPGQLVSAQFVLDLVLDLIRNHPIDSLVVRRQLQPFLPQHVDQFVHELLAFARSPLDMAAWDRQTEYVDDRWEAIGPPPFAARSSSAPQRRTDATDGSAAASVEAPPPLYHISAASAAPVFFGDLHREPGDDGSRVRPPSPWSSPASSLSSPEHRARSPEWSGADGRERDFHEVRAPGQQQQQLRRSSRLLDDFRRHEQLRRPASRWDSAVGFRPVLATGRSDGRLPAGGGDGGGGGGALTGLDSRRANVLERVDRLLSQTRAAARAADAGSGLARSSEAAAAAAASAFVPVSAGRGSWTAAAGAQQSSGGLEVVVISSGSESEADERRLFPARPPSTDRAAAAAAAGGRRAADDDDDDSDVELVDELRAPDRAVEAPAHVAAFVQYPSRIEQPGDIVLNSGIPMSPPVTQRGDATGEVVPLDDGPGDFAFRRRPDGSTWHMTGPSFGNFRWQWSPDHPDGPDDNAARPTTFHVRDSDSDVEVTREEKPWDDRSPILIRSDDTDSGEDVPGERGHRRKRKKKKEKDSAPTKKQKSKSRMRERSKSPSQPGTSQANSHHRKDRRKKRRRHTASQSPTPSPSRPSARTRSSRPLVLRSVVSFPAADAAQQQQVGADGGDRFRRRRSLLDRPSVTAAEDRPTALSDHHHSSSTDNDSDVGDGFDRRLSSDSDSGSTNTAEYRLPPIRSIVSRAPP